MKKKKGSYLLKRLAEISHECEPGPVFSLRDLPGRTAPGLNPRIARDLSRAADEMNTGRPRVKRRTGTPLARPKKNKVKHL